MCGSIKRKNYTMNGILKKATSNFTGELQAVNNSKIKPVAGSPLDIYMTHRDYILEPLRTLEKNQKLRSARLTSTKKK